MGDPLSYEIPNTPDGRLAFDRAKKSITFGCLFTGLVAFVFLVLGVGLFLYFTTRYDIVMSVKNAEAIPIRRIQFTFDGRTFSIDNIAPGATVRTQVTLRGSGPMTYAFPFDNYQPGTAATYLDEDCRGLEVGLTIHDGIVEPR